MRCAIVLAALAIAVSAQQCIDIPTVDTINLPHYLGRWYAV